MQPTIEKMNKDLSRRIMRRVYLISAIRFLVHPVLLKSLIAGVFLWKSTAYVSYANVIANAPHILDIKSDINFYSSALLNAESVTIALTLSVAVLLVWITFDMISKRTHSWI